MNAEKELFSQVESLRDQFPNTQELYREVAALMFFRYGITPTANRLYQLVRKGSMSAPAEALRQFWADLREKSQVRMDHADIPDALKEQLGHLLSQLWQEAQKEAKCSFEAYQSDCDTAVQHAEQKQLQAQLALQQEEQSKAALVLEKGQLEQALQLQRQDHAALQATLDSERNRAGELLRQNTDLRTQLNAQTDRFTQEINQLRHSMELSEERSRQSEKRALLEIDRERQAQQELKKQVREAQHKAEQQQLAAQAQLDKKEQELGQVRQQLGQLQGQEKANQAALALSQELMQEMQTELPLLRTRQALLQQESAQQKARIQELLHELEQANLAPQRVYLRRKLISNK